MEEPRQDGPAETLPPEGNGSESALAPSTAASPVAADACVVAVANQIAEMARHDTLEFARKIGRIVADGLYAGDAHGWRAQGPNRISLGRLVALLKERRSMSVSTGASRCTRSCATTAAFQR